MSRPSKLWMMMEMAIAASKRSACQRRVAVGAIITDLTQTNVLSIGYNGPPKRLDNVCPAGPAEGACGCIHAEVNALIKAPWHVENQTLFVTMSPCIACARLILNSRITQVYYYEPYRLPTGAQLLSAHGIRCTQLSSSD